MLIAGFAFTNGSIRLKQSWDGFHLQIYHNKYLAYHKAITDEHKARNVYSMAKELLLSETEKGFLKGIELVANELGYDRDNSVTNSSK